MKDVQYEVCRCRLAGRGMIERLTTGRVTHCPTWRQLRSIQNTQFYFYITVIVAILSWLLALFPISQYRMCKVLANTLIICCRFNVEIKAQNTQKKISRGRRSGHAATGEWLVMVGGGGTGITTSISDNFLCVIRYCFRNNNIYMN